MAPRCHQAGSDIAREYRGRGERALLVGVAALLLAAAAVLLLAGDSMAGKAVAFALFGVACVVAVSLVFFAIGRAEDAEREASAPHRRPTRTRARRRAGRGPRPPRRPI